MTDAASVDWSDSCARAQALTTAYYALLTGARETEIRTRTLDAEELVRYQPGDLKTLWVEMIAAQSECAKARGLPDPNRRFAITTDARSDIPGYNRNRCPI